MLLWLLLRAFFMCALASCVLLLLHADAKRFIEGCHACLCCCSIMHVFVQINGW